MNSERPLLTFLKHKCENVPYFSDSMVVAIILEKAFLSIRKLGKPEHQLFRLNDLNILFGHPTNVLLTPNLGKETIKTDFTNYCKLTNPSKQACVIPIILKKVQTAIEEFTKTQTQAITHSEYILCLEDLHKLLIKLPVNSEQNLRNSFRWSDIIAMNSFVIKIFNEIIPRWGEKETKEDYEKFLLPTKKGIKEPEKEKTTVKDEPVKKSTGAIRKQVTNIPPPSLKDEGKDTPVTRTKIHSTAPQVSSLQVLSSPEALPRRLGAGSDHPVTTSTNVPRGPDSDFVYPCGLPRSQTIISLFDLVKFKEYIKQRWGDEDHRKYATLVDRNPCEAWELLDGEALSLAMTRLPPTNMSEASNMNNCISKIVDAMNEHNSSTNASEQLSRLCTQMANLVEVMVSSVATVSQGRLDGNGRNVQDPNRLYPILPTTSQSIRPTQQSLPITSQTQPVPAVVVRRLGDTNKD